MRKAEYCAQKEGIKQKTGEPDMAAGELIKGRFQKDKKRARNSQKRWYHGLSGPFPGGFEPPACRLGVLALNMPVDVR